MYKKYKKSGIEWIGEIPENWEVKKIKFTDEVLMGQSPNSDDYNTKEIGLPFLQGNADFTNIYPQPRIWCDTSNKITTKEDILLSVRAPIGAVNISDQKYGIGRGLCAIRPQNTKSKLLYYLTVCLNDELNSMGTGSTYTAISVDEVKNVFIPSISKTEQKAIAKFLDHKTKQIDTLIEKKQKQIELLKEQRTAVINQAVTKGLDPNVKMKDSGIVWIGEIPEGWEIKKLKSICYMKGRIGWQGLKQAEFTEKGPYLITGMNFKEGKIRWDEVYHITEERYEEAPEIQLKVNDVLMTKDGTIGKLLFTDYLPDKTSLNSHLLVLRPLNNEFIPKYLYFILQSEYFKIHIELHKTGTTFYGITQE